MVGRGTARQVRHRTRSALSRPARRPVAPATRECGGFGGRDQAIRLMYRRCPVLEHAKVPKGGVPCAAEAPGAGEAWAEGILTYPDTRMMNEPVEDIDNQPRVLRAYGLTSTVRSSRCRSCAVGGIDWHRPTHIEEILKYV